MKREKVRTVLSAKSGSFSIYFKVFSMFHQVSEENFSHFNPNFQQIFPAKMATNYGVFWIFFCKYWLLKPKFLTIHSFVTTNNGAGYTFPALINNLTKLWTNWQICEQVAKFSTKCHNCQKIDKIVNKLT